MRKLPTLLLTIALLAAHSARADDLAFSAATLSVAETDGTATLTVSRAGLGVGVATVDYATADGTATAGADYTATNGTLSWADGDTNDKSIQVAVAVDGDAEGGETFTVTLSNPTNATLGINDTSTVTITNVDGGTLAFTSATFSAAEDAASIDLTVSRSGGGTGAVSVDYQSADDTAASGADYTAVSGTLQWADGDTDDKTITVALADDQAVEGDETFTVTLSNPSGAVLGAATQGTVTLTDVEPGRIQLTATAFTVTENDGNATITVERTSGGTGAASVAYATTAGTATAGSDYTETSGTLNWADGEEGEKSFTVPVANDSAVEEDETVTVTLSTPTGGTLGGNTSATLTIRNTDIEIRLSSSIGSAPESEGWIYSSAFREGGGIGAVTVQFTITSDSATVDDDYLTTSGTLEWADGDTSSKTIAIELVDDAIAEADETLTVTLTSPSGATLGTPATATLTITNDDTDFTPALTRIEPGVSGVTQTAPVDLSADSPLTAGTPLIELTNNLDVVTSGRLLFSQDATSGLLTSSIADQSVLSLNPVRVETTAAGETAGIYLADDGDIRIVTEGGVVVVCHPTSRDIEALQEAMETRGLAELNVDGHGDISLPTHTGSAPLVPDDQGRLVIPPEWFERFAVRPALFDWPAPEGTEEGVAVTAHPALRGALQVAHHFSDQTGIREQILFPAVADWASFSAAVAQAPGYQRLVQRFDGVIAFHHGGVVYHLYPDYWVNRGEPPARGEPRFRSVPDRNGDGTTDLLTIYPNGDYQYLYLVPSP